MEEMQSNIGRKLLTTLLERHYLCSTIDNVAGAILFSEDKSMTKTQLLTFLEENPDDTDEEVNIEVSRLSKMLSRNRSI